MDDCSNYGYGSLVRGRRDGSMSTNHMYDGVIGNEVEEE